MDLIHHVSHTNRHLTADEIYWPHPSYGQDDVVSSSFVSQCDHVVIVSKDCYM